jgi:hypothetical protein
VYLTEAVQKATDSYFWVFLTFIGTYFSQVFMLPKGWSSKESKSRGIPYYINEYTKETSWEKPTEAAKKPMSDSVQALHLLKKHSVSNCNL